MSAFRPESYAEALSLAQNRPRKPRAALRSVSLSARERPLRSHAISRNGASGLKRRPSSAVPYATNSLKARKTKKTKKAKKLTDGQLKKRVWKQFSLFIRTRRADAEGMVKCCTCIVVKHWKEMQAGHFLRGRLNANLFDERGCNEQCYGCNVGRDGNVVEYYEWMLVNHGKEVIDELRRKNNVTHKWQPGELLGLLTHYKQLNAVNPLLQNT